MEIRKRLTYQFVMITAVILFIAELSIYIFSAYLWKENFIERLNDKTNTIIGFLSETNGSLNDLGKFIDKSRSSYLPLEEVRIYDYKKEMVYTSNKNLGYSFNNVFLDQIKIDGIAKTKYGAYTVLGNVYKGRFDRLIVITGAIDIFGIKKLANLRIILSIVFILSLIVAFFTGRVFANKALEPILNVIKEVPAIDEQNLHLRVDEGNGKDEIARLAKTFNRMLERLENAFRIQKTFIANASHELRTPLSYIMGQMEVTLLKDRTSEEYKETLTSVLEDVKMMNETNDRLLLLAITSSDTFNIPFAEVRIDEVLWDARTIVLKSNPANQVNISFNASGDEEQKLTIFANEHLIKVAFVNLMDNGCKYSDDNTVYIHLGSGSDHLIIKISDKGIGIPDEELALIFEPFFRGRNTPGRKGHGLGLAMVRKIIQHHGGNIQVASKIQEGTEFTVTLPCSV